MRYKKLLFTLLFATVGTFYSVLKAQDDETPSDSTQLRIGVTGDDYKVTWPNMLPPTPNAAALGQFGNIPVSYYTGMADINIPLYEIELDGMKFPISLAYNASGIKVAQEASWVGLGWSLNAGGCITRTVADNNDLNTRISIGYFYDYKLEELCNDRSRFPLVAGKSVKNPFDSASNGYGADIDKEPDLFSFNFGQHAGSFFFLKQNSKPVMKVRKEYIDIRYNFEEDSWIATDGFGFRYYFGGSETSRDVTSVSFLPLSMEGQGVRGPEFIEKYSLANMYYEQYQTTTAWYLDSIVAPNHDKIEFQYKSEWFTTPVNAIEEKRVLVARRREPSPPQAAYYNINYSSNIMRQSVLTKVLFKNGHIDFATSERVDLDGKNMSYIDPYHPDQILSKLDDLIIYNKNQKCIKFFHFGYQYMGDTSSYLTCRLLLDRLTEIHGSQSLNPYHFQYNQGELPRKNSRQIDFWGFYNRSKAPKEWNTVQSNEPEGTLIPALIAPEPLILDGNFLFNGRDRSPDIACMKHGILESITYPTGGSSRFEYEPHDFNNPFYAASNYQQIINKASLLTFHERKNETDTSFETVSVENITFELQDSTWLNIDVNMKHILECRNPTQPIYFVGGLNFGTLSLIREGSSEVINIPLPDYRRPPMATSYEPTNDATRIRKYVPPGKYRFQMDVEYPTYPYIESSRCVESNDTPNSYTDMTCCNYKLVRYYVEVSVGQMKENKIVYGGGLRVKEIQDSIPNQQALVKKFNYQNNGKSSGILFIPPLHHTTYTQDFLGPASGFRGEYPNMGRSDYLLVTSMPFVDLTPQLSGSPIGYSTVEEIVGDTVGQDRTVYTFTNENDKTYPHYDYTILPPAHLYNYGKLGNRFFTATQNVCPGQPAIIWLQNGFLKKVEKFDRNKFLVEKKTYAYSYVNALTTEGFGLCAYAYYSNADLFRKIEELIWKGILPFGAENHYEWSYCMIAKNYFLPSESSWLLQETITNYFDQMRDSIVQSISYGHDIINYMVKNSTITTSQGAKIEYKTTYPTMLTDPFSLLMQERSLMNLPVEQSKFVNDQLSESKKTTFASFSNQLLPYRISYKQKSNPEEQRLQYHNYDSAGNPAYITQDEAISAVYLWSYNLTYPVIEVKNATYEQVQNAISSEQLNTLSKASSPSDATINALGVRLRNNLPNAEVTTYTYDPLIGATSITDPRGHTIYYDYDIFGRLREIYSIENGVKQAVEGYEYHYKN
ncbi:MAG: hypothetical protein LBN18_07825 [Dysgonamonadaceae bacterium]|jgi:YD repeat-containing protein|nr:hypothetical protein [Dysgonamonadaceae bacterium]